MRPRRAPNYICQTKWSWARATTKGWGEQRRWDPIWRRPCHFRPHAQHVQLVMRDAAVDVREAVLRWQLVCHYHFASLAEQVRVSRKGHHSSPDELGALKSARGLHFLPVHELVDALRQSAAGPQAQSRDANRLQIGRHVGHHAVGATLGEDIRYGAV